MAKRVLIVDDDHNTVKYLSVVLNEHGYETAAAYDGREGLRELEQKTPDLLVLDIMMPKKSGLVLFKQLKQTERFRNIPVLMLTGVAGVLEELERHKDETFERPYDALRETLKKQIREMREEGQIRPEMFMDKPVEPAAFIEKVRQLIGS